MADFKICPKCNFKISGDSERVACPKCGTSYKVKEAKPKAKSKKKAK